jgi:hypothetical protein
MKDWVLQLEGIRCAFGKPVKASKRWQEGGGKEEVKV